MTVSLEQIVLSLVDDKELVFRFFAVFSRFEYALKRGGFLSNKELAEADWDSYANDLRGRFASIKSDPFNEAIGYLVQEPPKKQIVSGNQLAWQESPRGNGESDEAYVLRLVRTVRNNLFHGGKFPFPLGAVPDVARNRRLIESALAILDGCLELNASVRDRFQEVA